MNPSAIPEQSLPATGAKAMEETSAKRIFIVEDENVIADNLEELLKSMGYVIVGKAASGEMAIEEVAQVKPDLVLMDIHLKGKMDGVEAAQVITGQHETPIVYLTVDADPLTLNRIQVSTPFGYVLKPFDERELHIVVEIAIYRGAVEAKLKKLNCDLQAALSQVKTLSGLLPICAWCKKIRNDEGYWLQLEEYLTSHTNAQLSHGMCPECFKNAQMRGRGN